MTRALLHKQYGGSRMTGIVPSGSRVFLFHQKHDSRDGWGSDGWRSDGYFYYTGSTNESSNRAIETAWSRGRRLQLMEMLPDIYVSGTFTRLHRYVDAFVVDGIEEAKFVYGDRLCHVPRFRLRTVDDATHHPGQILPPGDPRRVEVRRVERLDLLCRGSQDNSLKNERPETRLSKVFERYLLAQGYTVHRLGIRHTRDCTPLLTDTWVGHLNLIVEAKAGKSVREDARMAIGQLADYTRFIPGALRAVLLPARPEGDLLRYITSQDADVIWPEGSEWCTTAGWYRAIGATHVSAR